MLDTILIVSIVLIVWWMWTMRMPRSFPPGPRLPLPIIGDSYKMTHGSLTATIKSMRKQYGDVFGFYLTSNWKVVFVCDPQLLNQVAFSKDFSSRHNKQMWHRIRGGASLGRDVPGVLTSSGQTWVEQRRFCLSTLRDFGFGKQTMEEFILEELDKFIESLEAKSAAGTNPINPKDQLGASIINSLWRMISGTTYKQDDKQLADLTKKVHYLITELSKPTIHIAMQYRFFEEVFERLGLMYVYKAIGSLIAAADEAIETNAKQFDSTQPPSNFIEAYLAKMQAETDPKSSFYGASGMLNLQNDLIDLFAAGVETTTSTLTWAIYFMVKHPEIQVRVQRELDDIAGTGGRQLMMSDRAMTPYTEAVLLEVQRRGNILPLAGPHTSPADRVTRIGKYEIPPNTKVLFAIGEVHNDPAIFENPESFNPDRFISKDGTFKAHPQVIPYGIGKRRCLGESLAKSQLYLYFTRILQLYHLEARTELTDKTNDGLAVSPKHFEVSFVPR